MNTIEIVPTHSRHRQFKMNVRSVRPQHILYFFVGKLGATLIYHLTLFILIVISLLTVESMLAYIRRYQSGGFVERLI